MTWRAVEAAIRPKPGRGVVELGPGLAALVLRGRRPPRGPRRDVAALAVELDARARGRPGCSGRPPAGPARSLGPARRGRCRVRAPERAAPPGRCPSGVLLVGPASELDLHRARSMSAYGICASCSGWPLVASMSTVTPSAPAAQQPSSHGSSRGPLHLQQAADVAAEVARRGQRPVDARGADLSTYGDAPITSPSSRAALTARVASATSSRVRAAPCWSRRRARGGRDPGRPRCARGAACPPGSRRRPRPRGRGRRAPPGPGRRSGDRSPCCSTAACLPCSSRIWRMTGQSPRRPCRTTVSARGAVACTGSPRAMIGRMRGSNGGPAAAVPAVGRRSLLAAAGLGAASLLTGCRVRLEDDAPRVPLLPTRELAPDEGLLLHGRRGTRGASSSSRTRHPVSRLAAPSPGGGEQRPAPPLRVRRLPDHRCSPRMRPIMARGLPVHADGAARRYSGAARPSRALTRQCAIFEKSREGRRQLSSKENGRRIHDLAQDALPRRRPGARGRRRHPRRRDAASQRGRQGPRRPPRCGRRHRAPRRSPSTRSADATHLWSATPSMPPT